MWNGKKKAVTFSYDDGVTQDKRFIEILNRFGLKATFNLNSALLGKEGSLIRNGVTVNHTKIKPEDVRAVYDGHEVAAHTLTHPALRNLPDEAWEACQKAYDYAVKADYKRYEMASLFYMARCHSIKEDFDKALSFYEQTLELADSLNIRNFY